MNTKEIALLMGIASIMSIGNNVPYGDKQVKEGYRYKKIRKKKNKTSKQSRKRNWR